MENILSEEEEEELEEEYEEEVGGEDSEIEKPSVQDCVVPVRPDLDRTKLRNAYRQQRMHSAYLEDGQQHMVFHPHRYPMQYFDKNLSPHSARTSPSHYLKERRMDFETVTKATQFVLKEHTKELLMYKTQTLNLASISERVRTTIAKQKQKSTPDLYRMFHELEEEDRAHSALPPTAEETDLQTGDCKQVSGTSEGSLPNRNRGGKLQLLSMGHHPPTFSQSMECCTEPALGDKIKWRSSNHIEQHSRVSQAQADSMESMCSSNRRVRSISAREVSNKCAGNVEAKYFAFTPESVQKHQKQVTFKKDTQRKVPGIAAFPILELSEEPNPSPKHVRIYAKPFQPNTKKSKSKTKQDIDV